MSRDALRLQSSIKSMVNSIPSARQRTRAQTAAFLLGAYPELPSTQDKEINRTRAVQHLYEGMAEQRTPSPVDELTAQRCQAQLEKIEFRVPLHTLDRNQSTTYVDRSHSESDCPIDILDSIKATMDVSKTYQHLGWRLSTARRIDPPHRLLTTHDINSAFKAARTEHGSGRKTKKVAIEIVNTAVRLKEKQTRQQAGTSSAGGYTKELETVTSTLRCSDHPNLGEDTFCWVDASQPNTPHYPLCTRDLQDWAKYLHETGDLDFVTLPRTPHFNEVRTTRKERTTVLSPLQRVPTEIISPVIHNHIHLSPATNDTISDGMFTRERGEGYTAPQPLKRTFALYMESDEESDDDELPQGIEDVLRTVHSRYPAMNFPQYVDKLKDRGIFYLPTAAHFGIRFYEEKVGMSEGSAYTFQSCICKSYERAELAKERRKTKGKKKARAHGNENEENIHPISF
ncbi:uncharacterized protein F5891DRAFT_1196729 [Suillus fuscotomentosus]|uniref:Uncharacterized protein n=1 Tax=Suillus fuscotomentosus TaxID=1912939 RepID=A0AAD4DSX7_9AGAM|nr:uncharacterized protein F5891DRAFT_1196729 [Suillus fuscotomentosus]KAG1893199.1 hypothetical protein F5891DRAFT_1196729 [Suillus fuscotomentosus]